MNDPAGSPTAALAASANCCGVKPVSDCTLLIFTTAFAGTGACPGATTLFKWSKPNSGCATGFGPKWHAAPEAATCASVMSEEAQGTFPVSIAKRGVIVLGSP